MKCQRFLLSDKEAKLYPDVITLAFWMRKASMMQLKKRFADKTRLRFGSGIIFHISPSNVPVNYAYSLVTGLICGNANVVRIPSKNFPQVKIIVRALNAALEKFSSIKPYIVLVQYGHDSAVNDAFSSICNVRVIWGGDATIAELRNSKMPPRSTEITFADRYSMAVIDANAYLATENKVQIANDFFNDTYLTDQNACTSPRAVVWCGTQKEEAKTRFWHELHELTRHKYHIQGVQAVNKLTSAYLLAAKDERVKRVYSEDNLIVRVRVPKLTVSLMNYKDHSGYFFEYDCNDIKELKNICNDLRCQTISYIGEATMFGPLLECGVKGIDRIVPVGKTMDFDLIWDGYNLFDRMTRIVSIV